MKVTLKALPGVVFSAPIPKADGSPTKYTNMRAGSDSILPVDPFTVEVEAQADELPEVTAYRLVLRQVVVATLDEFLETRKLVMERAAQQISL